MNEENESAPALSPWINEHLDPTWAKVAEKAKTLKEIETLDEERVKNPAAAIYRRAEEIVLEQLAKNPGLKWKLNGIKEDLAAHRDSTLTEWFAKEVIALAEKQM